MGTVCNKLGGRFYIVRMWGESLHMYLIPPKSIDLPPLPKKHLSPGAPLPPPSTHALYPSHHAVAASGPTVISSSSIERPQDPELWAPRPQAQCSGACFPQGPQQTHRESRQRLGTGVCHPVLPRGLCHLGDTVRLHSTLPDWSLGWSPVPQRREEFTKDQPKLN